MGSFRSRLLLATALALMVALSTAQSSFAGQPLSPKIKATVRVESSAQAVAPATSLVFDWTKTFYDTAGNPYRPGHASALGALAAVARAQGFTWEAGYGGNFITQIGGFSSLPDFSQGWIYAVNGAGYPIVDVGALDFRLKQTDSVLFAQSPDATFTRHGKALVLRFDQSDRAYETGQPVVITVYADDLEKVNSTADADRFEVDDTFVETSAQFQPVTGATVHIGSRTAVSDGSGQVTLADLADGTYRVWAERDMDGASFFVRSQQRSINVAAAVDMSALTAKPNPFAPGHTVRFSFGLSRSATVKYTVRNSGGTLMASLTRRVAGGDVTLRWSGENAAGKPVRPGTYRVRLTAVDTWGRSAAPLSTTIVAR